jgi:class 3 adenylate cyclase
MPDQPMRCRVGIATGVAIIGDSDRAGPLQVVGDASSLEGEGSSIRSSNRR